MLRLSPARRRVVTSASVRVGGAVLTAVGLVIGLRVLGAEQFGLSVVALAIGQLAAFPMTAMERLMIRAVSTGDGQAAHRITRRAAIYSALLCLSTAVVVTAAALRGETAVAVLAAAAGLTGLSAGMVTITQAVCRSVGRIGWGQVPNEIVRPFATIAAYPLAAALTPQFSGAVATLVASLTTLAVMAAAPRGLLPAPGPVRLSGQEGTGMVSMLLISASALVVERGLTVLVGWQGGAADVAAFAVVVRVIQLANFGQSFGMFYYSPAMAEAFAGEDRNLSQIGRLSRRVRLAALTSSLPAVAVCLFGAHLVERVMGADLHLGLLLALASAPIAATAVGGPSQLALIMAGEEQQVARVYVAGVVLAGVAVALMGAGGALAVTVSLSTAFVFWNIAQVVAARSELGRWV